VQYLLKAKKISLSVFLESRLHGTINNYIGVYGEHIIIEILIAPLAFMAQDLFSFRRL